MMWYQASQEPFGIFGLHHIRPEAGKYWRLPPHMLEAVPHMAEAFKRCAGGRLRFQTDSSTVAIRYKVLTEQKDRGFATLAAAGMDVYLGTGLASRFIGCVAPETRGYQGSLVEGQVKKPTGMQTVTINLPRTEQIGSLEIGLDESASLAAAPAYRFNKPVVFYGSSITEGRCAPRPGAAYTSMVCRWLDSDCCNYGFSAQARGEQAFAQYLAEHPAMGAFVMDYDHNAPTVEHLQRTHLPFYQRVRAAHPQVPVLLISRPDVDPDPKDSEERRKLILNTYHTARKNGDQQVFFLDGGQFFEGPGREECTVDGCHPGSLGFLRMAEAVYPVLRQMLHGGA